MPKTAKKTPTEQQTETIAQHADRLIAEYLAEVLDYDALYIHERASVAMIALERHVGQTPECAGIEDADDRQSRAENLAAFHVGLAIGRKLAGAR